MSVKADLTAGTADEEYTFNIYTWGSIDSGDCGKTDPTKQIGDEFRPLKESKDGVENPWADASRGRIDPFTFPIG